MVWLDLPEKHSIIAPCVPLHFYVLHLQKILDVEAAPSSIGQALWSVIPWDLRSLRHTARHGLSSITKAPIPMTPPVDAIFLSTEWRPPIVTGASPNHPEATISVFSRPEASQVRQASCNIRRAISDPP